MTGIYTIQGSIQGIDIIQTITATRHFLNVNVVCDFKQTLAKITVWNSFKIMIHCVIGINNGLICHTFMCKIKK